MLNTLKIVKWYTNAKDCYLLLSWCTTVEMSAIYRHKLRTTGGLSTRCGSGDFVHLSPPLLSPSDRNLFHRTPTILAEQGWPRPSEACHSGTALPGGDETSTCKPRLYHFSTALSYTPKHCHHFPLNSKYFSPKLFVWGKVRQKIE